MPRSHSTRGRVATGKSFSRRCSNNAHWPNCVELFMSHVTEINAFRKRRRMRTKLTVIFFKIQLLRRPWKPLIHQLASLDDAFGRISQYHITQARLERRVFTARRCAQRGLSHRKSVRLIYISLSVTLVDCAHMVLSTIMISSPYGSPVMLVIWRQISSPHSNGMTFKFNSNRVYFLRRSYV